MLTSNYFTKIFRVDECLPIQLQQHELSEMVRFKSRRDIKVLMEERHRISKHEIEYRLHYVLKS